MIVFIRVICFFIGLCLAPVVVAEEKLIFAVDIIRDGDRTPIFQLPASNYEFSEGSGQLTPIGMKQMYELGAYLRTFYVKQSGLLPEHYFPDSILVQSTDTDRTLMSAQCFLMGLYPLGTGPKGALPESYQSIPIHSIGQLPGFVRLSSESKLLDNILKQPAISSEWKKKTKELKPHWAHWSELIGLKIDRLEQLISIGDTLKIYRIHQIPLPGKMTNEEADSIIRAGDWVLVNIYKYPQIGRLSLRKLMQTLADDFNQKGEGKSKNKYKLISAHESTLLSFMGAVGAPLKEVPRYASHLHLGLFEDNGGHQVKIVFNGEPVVVPACRGSSCSLDQFVQILKKE